MGKVAMSPLPSRGSPPLQSGGGGGESEVAHLWAKWLRHPCRLGDPHHFRVGGKIRSGPLVGKVATSPLPSRGSPPLQSGGQNQKWPTCGQSGYVTPAVSGIPTASERGAKSEVAHLWAKWLRHPCRLGDPHRCRAGGNQKWPTCGQSGYVTPAVSGIPTAAERGEGESEVAHLWAKWLRNPCRLGDPHRCRAGGGGGNQKWPTCGQSGYVTPAVSGIPTASEWGAKSEAAHLWAKWLRHPCRHGDPHRCRAGGGGSEVAHLWAKWLRHACRLGVPIAAERGGGNQKWPTCGQSGYVTPAVSGIPTASEWGAKSEAAHLWAKWLRHPCRLKDLHRCRAGGGGSEVADLWANWLRHPCRLGDPRRFRAGGKSEVAHLWAKWLRHPCRLGDPHRFRAGGGGGQKWPTCGQSGYVTPAVSGIPTASEWGAKKEVAHLWAKWLRHPCRLGDPHRFRVGGKIRSGPLVGKLATSPLPSRGSPPLQSGGQNQKWPTCGQSGYVTPAVSGIPTASERGENQKWPTCGQSGYVTPAVSGIPTAAEPGGNQKWPTCGQSGYVTPAVSGIPTAAERGGGEIRSGPLVGKVATSPLPSRGSPPLPSGGGGGGNQKWPTCGQSGYVTPAVSGIPTAAERGGGGIRSGPLVGKVAMSPVPSRGSPPLQSGGQNQKRPTCGQSGYVTPCRTGDPHRCRAGGGGIRSGPLVGKVAMSPVPSRGSPPLQSGGQNQKRPTCGQSGYATPAVTGIHIAAERGQNQK